MGFVTPEEVAEDVAILASHHVPSLIGQEMVVDSGDVAVSLMVRREDMERCVCHEIGTRRASEWVLWR
jgi:hypothetical protein